VSDPFALLQLPSTFTLSSDALDLAWMRASATAHPDAGGSVDHAAQLNEARELLANLESRANLRLNMLGGPGADQDQRLPDGFLMEMLELRETIDAEIETEGAPAIERWKNWVDAECQKAYTKITPVLDAESAPEEARTEVRLVLNQVRYLERLREQL
jgi:curved DNA-binding protein CbpA